MDDDKPRDKWSKFDIGAKAFAGILIPIIIAVLGGIFADIEREHNRNQLAQQSKADSDRLEQQSKFDSAQRQADRVALLLKHLASPVSNERLLAIKAAEYFGKENQLPSVLVPVLVEIAAKGTPEEKKAATDALSSLPSRVYIHIPSEQQRNGAKQIQAKLEEQALTVPGIQRVNVAPSSTELRFFKTNERGEAERIVGILKSAGVDARISDLSDRFNESSAIRQNHFELWFAAN